MDSVIRISPEGSLMFLYDDNHPLLNEDVDVTTVMRASNVSFDNAEGVWRIHEIQPDGMIVVHPEGYEKRSDAIQAEIAILEERLRDPDYVKGLEKLFSRVCDSQP
jgi:hypothetical protein